MLHQENKTCFDLLLCLVLMFCVFSSCKNDNGKEVVEKEVLYLNKSIAVISNEEYFRVINKAKDSLQTWCDNRLEEYAELWFYTYKLDSLICFDRTGKSFIGALLLPCNKEDCLQDDIRFFYGVKIKEEWFFFSGATVALPREYYQKDTHTPLSFDKLHEIAMNNIFNGYLKKKDNGFWKNLFGKTEYEIDDTFFNAIKTPRVPFEGRKTDSNVYYSCREINNKQEYEDCFFQHDALAIWNEDSACVNKDTYLYSPEFPVINEIRKLHKGEFLRVIERIDNSNWCDVRMWDGVPYRGFIEKNAITTMK